MQNANDVDKINPDKVHLFGVLECTPPEYLFNDDATMDIIIISSSTFNTIPTNKVAINAVVVCIIKNKP